MSATYNNQIEIVLFENTRRTNEKAPHRTGTVTFPDGTKYDVALWGKVSKNGNPFEAGVLKLPDPKYAKQGAPRYEQRSAAPRQDQDIPF